MNYKHQKKENWDCELKAMQTTLNKLQSHCAINFLGGWGWVGGENPLKITSNIIYKFQPLQNRVEQEKITPHPPKKKSLT